MLIHVVNRETCALSAYTPAQINRMARAFVKPTERRYQCHWVEFDQTGVARIVVQSVDRHGWSQTDGIVI